MAEHRNDPLTQSGQVRIKSRALQAAQIQLRDGLARHIGVTNAPLGVERPAWLLVAKPILPGPDAILDCHSQDPIIAAGDGTVGRCPVTVVPWVGADRTSSWPLSAASRSAMFRRPEPIGVCWASLLGLRRHARAASSRLPSSACRSPGHEILRPIGELRAFDDFVALAAGARTGTVPVRRANHQPDRDQGARLAVELPG